MQRKGKWKIKNVCNLVEVDIELLSSQLVDKILPTTPLFPGSRPMMGPNMEMHDVKERVASFENGGHSPEFSASTVYLILTTRQG